MSGEHVETRPSVRADMAAEPPKWSRQLLQLVRAEFRQIRRYRTALFYVVSFPVVLAVVSLMSQGQYAGSGVDAGALSLVSLLPVLAAAFGLMHVSNVYAVRREGSILKRLRVSGVPPSAIIGATCVTIVLLVLATAALIVGLGIAAARQFPADPVMLLLAVVASGGIMTLLGVWFTRFTSNAESTQMASLIPFLLVLFCSGAMLPLEFYSDWVARAVWFTPLAPLTDLYRSAYFGHDFFGGRVSGAEALGGVELWLAAAPALLVTAGWLVLSCYLARSVRWSPREGQ
ncbi:ABC transporter permease [Nocardiopsis sp. CNT-189]|uniref:ABC transporter permease n=1 Tax=Nocardiopsis oceanisediminis TaxID=2816862 RepID=UPI003B2DD77B